MSAITDTPQVRTLLLTDLVDSTTLVERLGDQTAAELFRAHDRIVLELQQRWRGRLIDRSDGLLLIFERPIDGLGFALDYVRGLRDLGREHKQALQARAGLHVGEVLVWENSLDAVRLGSKSLEVEGLAKPLAGRLMALARPGQILLSATAEPLAHRAARELGERGELLVWKSYGRWRFKGLPEAQDVHEVGEPGLAPLRMPAHTPKAWRDLPLWRRPAALAAETLLLAGLVLSGWFLTRPQPAIAFNERDWVVVGDLRNLTGNPRLDDSLEQAFRISLEQSRYVNVLSDLKVRETLQRMQQKADALVDRTVGSEIAQRDGARVLLLPTVAEVGGRLRVSAEVVDPRTQATVYAVSADGKGIESALASIDEVTDQLRETLGEALQNVQETSLPLPNVSTPNLDALKAYALAKELQASGHRAETTIGMYRRAIELDPGFALAYAGIGDVHGGIGQLVEARASWDKALALKERLSPEEQMRIQLQTVRFGSPSAQLALVQRYLQLYPDRHDARGTLAQMLWHNNDFTGAEAQARLAAVPAAEKLGIQHYMHGIALLGLERYADAIGAFRKAREAGFRGAGVLYARVYDAQRQHAQSDKIHAARMDGKQGGWSGFDAITTALDRGHWRQAEQVARVELGKAVAGKDLIAEATARAALLEIAAMSGDNRIAARLGDELQWQRPHAEAMRSIYPPSADEHALMIGLAAAMADDASVVRGVLARVKGSPIFAEYPKVGQQYEALLAERERLDGMPEAAVLRLRPIVGGDDALLAVRTSYLRALRAAGQREQALDQARRLAKQRGRAFAEAAHTGLLEAYNVGGSTLALLDEAEIASAMGRKQDAVEALRQFKAAWPAAELPRPLQARLAKLEGLESGL